MKYRSALYFTALFLFIQANGCGQSKGWDRLTLGRNHAVEVLRNALNNKSDHNVIDNKTLIISDSLTAVRSVEPLLFNIYGKENIVKQRPYEAYLISNHWIISGTLPSGYLGGTFLIIMDARNCRVLKITHGK